MKSFQYTITDPEGMHARPAGLLVKQASGYGCQVTIEKNGKSVDAKRIFGIMGLGIKAGETITVATDGEAEETAISELEEFFQNNL